jgi:hypothetical protein
MSKKKLSKDKRQESLAEAFHILKKAVLDSSHVDEDVWAPAIWSLLMIGYYDNDFTYEEFSKEVENAKKFYKNNLDNEVDRSG